MALFIVDIICALMFVLCVSPLISAQDPDLGKNFTQLVESKGFVPEEHHVTTEDGYNIGLFRVRCRQHCCPEKVVYMSTPLWMDSDSFVADFANNSLAFLLADHGFDVWIGNARGTKYSRSRVGNANPSRFDTDFFDFTFIDIGLKDIPAGIDYTLNATGRHSLFYMGHSQATAGAFALLSQRPEFNDKIIAMVAMCPFRRISCNVGQKETHGVLSMIARNYDKFMSLASVLGEFPPTTKGFRSLCRYLPSFCDSSFHFGLGESPNFNSSRMEFYSQILPAPSSVKNMLFFGQLAERSCNGDFEVYDFDYDKVYSRWSSLSSLFGSGETNMEKYGSPRPPSFPASGIRIPVKLYYAQDDGYAPPEEAHRLMQELPNFRGAWDMGPKFGHYDLIMPTYNKSHVMDAIRFMDSFTEPCHDTNSS